MADPGKIALMLELQLAAGPALETIEKFSDAFMKIERQVAALGKNIDGMAVSVRAVVKSVNDAIRGASDITDVEKVIDELMMHHSLLDQTRMKNGAKINILNQKQLETLIELNEAIRDFSNEEQIAFNEKLKNNKVLKEALRNLGKVVAEEEHRFNKRNEALTGVMGVLVSTAGTAGKKVTELAAGLAGLDARFDLMAFAVGVVTVALNDFIIAQDKFAKGNYAASGSFNKLALDMTMYELTLAATTEAAGKAMEAVIGAGIRAEKLQKEIIPTVAKMARAYGVSEEETAKFAVTMLSLGVSAYNVNGALDYASKAIASAGLSSAEATNLIKKMTDAMWEFYTLTGSKEMAERAGRDIAAFAVMAREANVDVNAAMEALAKIQKGGADLTKLMGGIAITGGDPTKMMLSSIQRIGEVMEITKGMSGDIKKTVVESLTGMSLAEATAIDMLVNKQKERYKITGALTEEQFKRITDEVAAQQTLEQAYSTTFSTISGIMAETVIPIFKTLVAVLTPFMIILNYLMVPFGVILRAFREFVGILYTLVDSKILNGIMILTASIILFSTAFGKLLLTLAAFSGIFKIFESLMDNANPIIRGIAVVLTFLAAILFINYLRLTNLSLAFTRTGVALKSLGPIAMGVWSVLKLLPLIFSPSAWAAGFSFLLWRITKISNALRFLGWSGIKKILFGKSGLPGTTIFDVFLGGLNKITSATLGKLPLIGKLFARPTLPPSTPPSTPPVPPAATAAKGLGFWGYMQAIKRGILIFARASALIIKGATTFLLAITMIAAPIVLLAGLASVLKVSAGDFLIGIGALGAGLLAMKILIPMITALGAAAAGAMKGAAIISAVVLLLGVSFYTAALGFSLMAESLETFANMNIGDLSKTFLMLGNAMIKFAGASVIALLGLIPLALFISGLAIAGTGMALALAMFPTQEFLKVAIGMEKFADSVSKLSNASAGMSAIKDALSALKSVDAKGLEAMGAYSSQLEKLADIVGKIGAVDIYDSLAGRVIANEANFDKAASIIKNYADKVAVDIERIGDITPGKAEPTKTATNEVRTRVMVERDEKVLASLEKQTTVLQDIAKKDSNESTNKKLDELVQSVKELVDYHKRNAGTHPAAQW